MCDSQDDCPNVADAGQADADHDGIGDACDPCTNGAPVTRGKVVLSKLITGPPDDDKLTFKGEMTFPFPFNPPFYPPNVGARVLLVDQPGTTLLDVQIPTGFYDSVTHVGWKAGGSGSWTYKNPAGVQGITKVALKAVPSVPGHMKFTVTGKYGNWHVTGQTVPVTATIIVDAPVAETGQCGVATFPGLPAPACAVSVSGSTMTCK